jgi:hypothetical protein
VLDFLFPSYIVQPGTAPLIKVQRQQAQQRDARQGDQGVIDFQLLLPCCGRCAALLFPKKHFTKRHSAIREKFRLHLLIFQSFAIRCAWTTASDCHHLSSDDKSATYFVFT